MEKERSENLDYCLVLMPNVSTQTYVQPATGLGLLSAYLQRDGYRGKVVYANLFYLQTMGMELLERISEQQRTFQGDWLFAGALFPEMAREEHFDGYVQELKREIPGFLFFGEEVLRRHLLELRQKTEQYLEEMVERVLALRPRMVGCSVAFTQQAPTLAFLKKLKEKAPSIVTVIGGPNCETVMGATLHREFPWVDYVVSGEGDDIISPLMRQVASEKGSIPAAAAPRGLFVPEHRQAGYPPPEEWLAVKEDLGDLPLPDYDDFFQTVAELPGLERSITPMIPFEASRGCWWAQKKPCAFCSVNKVTSRYRGRPAEQILDHLAELARKYRMEQFFAVDSILDMRHVTQLMPRLEEQGAPYRLFFEVTARMSKTQLQAMAAAGAVWLQPGIESLHSEALRLMNKGTEAWQNIQFLRHARELGLIVTWMLLYGLPGEDDAWYEEMADRIPLLTHLHPPAFLNPILYMRNSAYFEEPERYGLELRPFAINRHFWPDRPDLLQNTTYLFDNVRTADHRGLRDGVYYSPPGWERVSKAVKTWNGLFRSETPPQLTARDLGETIEIFDSRPAAVRERHCLTGWASFIHRECEAAPRTEDLLQTLANAGLERREAVAALQALQADQLILAVDGRQLTLATAAAPPVPEFFTLAAIKEVQAWSRNYQLQLQRREAAGGNGKDGQKHGQ